MSDRRSPAAQVFRHLGEALGTALGRILAIGLLGAAGVGVIALAYGVSFQVALAGILVAGIALAIVWLVTNWFGG